MYYQSDSGKYPHLATTFKTAFSQIVSRIWSKKFYGIAIVIWELIRARAVAWANEKIDENAERYMTALAEFIAEYLSYPLSWAAIAALVIFSALFIHSYIAEHKTRMPKKPVVDEPLHDTQAASPDYA